MGIRQRRQNRRADHARQYRRENENPFEVDGVIHHFISIDPNDGLPVGHSHECSDAYWTEWPCGCHPIKNSGGTSPRCEEDKRLEFAYKMQQSGLVNIHSEDFDLVELQLAKIEAALHEWYKHLCTCGAFDRPRRRAANVYANGLQMGVPLAVLRSHPDFPGTLPEKWEGRWVSLNPVWPEQTVDAHVGKLRTPCVWRAPRGEDTPTDLKEYRDGLEGTVIYVRPMQQTA